MIQKLAQPPVAEAEFSEEADGAISPAKNRTPAARAWNSALKLIRRIHLYSGLFMFPWVMLFAVTAYLFNHPRSFSDQPTRDFGPAEIADTPLATLPRPADLAGQLVQAIARAEAENGNTTQLRLIEPGEARFARSQAQVAAQGNGGRHTVLVNLEQGTGSVRTRNEGATRSEPAPFADSGIRPESSLADQLRNAAPQVLARLDQPNAEVQTVTVPDLLFQVEADGRPWQVVYNFDRGSLTALPAGKPLQELPTRNFLTRLHMTHGYSDRWDARWFWALSVDGMFVAMVFWGGSGILMWWQLKATRIWGAAFLLASAVVATAMTVGMHREMLATPLRTEASAMTSRISPTAVERPANREPAAAK